MVQRLDILERLHARLLEIVGTGLPMLTSSMRDADLEGLTQLREEMVAAIEVYAHYVHKLLGKALADGDTDVVRTAHDLKLDCIALQQAYRTFTARWAHRDGGLNWPEYRLSAIVMMKQIRNHVRAASLRMPVAGRAA